MGVGHSGDFAKEESLSDIKKAVEQLAHYLKNVDEFYEQ